MITKRYLSFSALLIWVMPWQVTAAFLAVTVGMQVTEFVARLVAVFNSNPESCGRIERLFGRQEDGIVFSANGFRNPISASTFPSQTTEFDCDRRRSGRLLRSHGTTSASGLPSHE